MAPRYNQVVLAVKLIPLIRVYMLAQLGKQSNRLGSYNRYHG